LHHVEAGARRGVRFVGFAACADLRSADLRSAFHPSSISIAPIIETIRPDRTFSDIFGHRRSACFDIAVTSVRQARARRALYLLRARCAFVVTNAQRAGTPTSNLSKNGGKILSAAGFSPRRALRFRHAKRAARELQPGAYHLRS